MKKIVVVLFIALAFMACSQKDRLRNKAISDAKEMIEKEAMKPERFAQDIRLEDITTVYESDSLCILNITTKNKNLLGMEVSQRLEFVHFGNSWFVHTPDNKETPIYLTKEVFENEKKGKIYENYQYDDAIYYRAALYLNKMYGNGSLSIPLKTGLWELENNKDDFKKDTDCNYLLLRSYEGVEESDKYKSEEKDISKEEAELFVSKDDIYFRIIGKSMLFWYNRTCLINHSNGESYGPWPICEKDEKIMPSKNKKDISDKIRHFLEEEGTMTIIIQHTHLFGTKSKHTFKMNLVGYNEASRFLK